jgi:alkyldihydroxyacetonephosphate synthase
MPKSYEIETRWWGWGDVNKTYPVEQRPTYIPFLEEQLDIRVDTVREPDPDLDAIDLRQSRLKPKVVEPFARRVGDDQVSTTNRDRIYHTVGKSYRDCLTARMGRVENPTDAVVYPGSEDEVVQILKLAEAEGLAVVPFCGGSSVVGGIEPLDRRPGGPVRLISAHE